MEKGLISVIVPVYKVEKYLPKCIESIINQTHKNIEIILVDDGSPDNCGKICDEYAQRDERIKVVHKENGGLSSARNAGLDIVTGKYISFIDSDDYIAENFIDYMYSVLKKENVDVVQCNYTRNELTNISEVNEEILVISSEKAIENLNSAELHGKYVIVCNKLYKYSIYKNLRFPIGKVNEDVYVTYLALDRANKVAIISAELYFYRITPSSIMEKTFSIKRYDALEGYENEINYFKKKSNVSLYKTAAVIYQKILKEYYLNTQKYVEEDKQQNLKMLTKKSRKNLPVVLSYSGINLRNKMKYILFCFWPALYYKLICIKDSLVKGE